MAAGDERQEGQEPRRPADLEKLLQHLDAARKSTSGTPSSELLAEIRRMAHEHLMPGDRLRWVMDSEDLAQDTVVDLIHAAEEFRGKTWREFLAFARALLERRKVNEARYHRVRKIQGGVGGDEALVGELVSESQGPEMKAASEEDIARAMRCVEGLAGSYREPLQMRLQGMGYEAIANKLGVTTATVRKRVSRALGMLRERWGR